MTHHLPLQTTGVLALTLSLLGCGLVLEPSIIDAGLDASSMGCEDCDAEPPACTEDECDAGTPVCTGNGCDGGAPPVECAGTGQCSDGDACTTGDTCQDGVCSGTAMTCASPPPPECSDSSTLWTYEGAGTCSAGECSYTILEIECPGGCVSGSCAPVICNESCEAQVFAADQPGANRIAWDGTYVYWSNSGNGGATDGSIMRLHFAGGAPEPLAEAQDFPQGIAVSDGSVYWVTGGAINSMSLAGGGVQRLLNRVDTVRGGAVEVDANRIHWTIESTGEFGQMQVGEDLPEIWPMAGSRPGGLAIDGTDAYWTASATGSILRMSPGLAPQLVWNTDSDPTQIALSATHIYWVEPGGREVRRLVRSGGGGPELVASDEGGPLSLAIDDTHVYYGDGWGILSRVPLTGGTPTELNTGSIPNDIVLTDHNVYWTDRLGNAVMRLPLCDCSTGSPGG